MRPLTRFFPLWLGLLMLAGCSGTASGGDSNPAVDVDRAGFTPALDCDDRHAAVHPGMAEVCGDSVDQDCSGADEACAACGDAVVLSTGCTCGGARHTDGICCGDAWHVDGYCCASTWQAGACASCGDGDGDGYDDALCGGDDCNDSVSAVHPGAAEACGDGVDQDCSGSDLTCPPPIETPTSIAEVAAACAAEPMRGTVYYYCDCGTGAQGGCVAGDDGNVGTDPLLPRQTIANAESRFGTLAVNDTVALCKGGAFDSAGNLYIGSNRCGAGSACNDLREYTPTTFAGTAKPIINNAAGDRQLFRFWNGMGGVRLLNLKLKGDGGTNGNHGFFFYEAAHDVTMCNLDLDAFTIAVYNESNAGNTRNIKLTGSYISNATVMGYLGGGDNDDISYNYWDGNGSSTVFDHTLYFASGDEITNVRVVGNYIRGQYGPTCLGAPVEGHMAVDGLLVKDNVVDIDAAATTGGCWGIEFNNFTNAAAPIYHRNAV
ncbi:MAG: putative metal-binding motif-containing protein, partial [Myxococcota bacterium]